jgi:hypothetical protein
MDEIPDPRQRDYIEVLHAFMAINVPFMVGGAYAMREYADIVRDTKDLDLFCNPRDYPAFLPVLEKLGYVIEVRNPDWLAKGTKNDIVVDLIFGTGNKLHKVSDSWIQRARTATLFDLELKLIPPEEMILSKIYVQERDRFDGADINHIIRKIGSQLDWRHLLLLLESHWELLFAQLLNFGFVYPSERHIVPEWLIRELISKLEDQLQAPRPDDRVCRGVYLAYNQYLIDVREWGYRS